MVSWDKVAKVENVSKGGGPRRLTAIELQLNSAPGNLTKGMPTLQARGSQTLDLGRKCSASADFG